MVVVAENDILIRVEPVQAADGVFPFLHCEILEWNKTTRQKCIDFLESINKAYVVADNDKLIKFCTGLGGKVLKQISKGTLIRFN